jgi:hypothetical protein
MVDPKELEKAKATGESYALTPFFFRQEYELGSERWVAWTGSPLDLQALFHGLLDGFPDQVDVLLMLVAESEPIDEDDSWRTFEGRCHREVLSAAIQEHTPLVFVDGGSELYVRSADGGDGLALDEHGILYVYSRHDGVPAPFKECGLEERTEELLNESAHWHIRPGHTEGEWQAFVARLGLRAADVLTGAWSRPARRALCSATAPAPAAHARGVGRTARTVSISFGQFRRPEQPA